MWSWKAVFVYVSRNEELCFIGSNYPNECIARCQLELFTFDKVLNM